MIPQEIFDKLHLAFPGALLECMSDTINPSAAVDPKRIRDIALFLRDSEKTQFDSLMCLSGVDYGGGKLGVVYHLDSTKHNHRITLKIELKSEDPHCPSVESVWKCANWHEREAFDLFGIHFDGHPDLRRILLPDDWEGHPLRKDYQLQEYYRGMKVPY
jgi:NADH-quinone oxidoreductase subunit C